MQTFRRIQEMSPMTRRAAAILFSSTAVFALAAVAPPSVCAQASPASAAITLDETVPPGANFNNADFRLWLPANAGPVRAIVLLVPGSNGDARDETGDAAWQAFAVKHQLALVGVHLTDKERSPFEEYANVSKGSGQAILDSISAFAAKSKHPEMANAPLFLWGMSAGGEVNYELVAWKPERVAAFVVNKGGIYYTALASKASRAVPGLLFIGGKDLESRIDIITGLFALNRRGGALWALAEEPDVPHVVGKSKDLTMMFFEDVMAARLGSGNTLEPMSEADGLVADIHAKTFGPAPAKFDANKTTAWLPTERVAKGWQAMETGKPVAP
jgi:poly(3-hydroxybutyrate) depolymerase